MVERFPSPKQRFKKNMASTVYNARSNVFTKEQNRYISRIFRSFHSDWHDAIADQYPLYVSQFVDLPEYTREYWFGHDVILEALEVLHEYAPKYRILEPPCKL